MSLKFNKHLAKFVFIISCASNILSIASGSCEIMFDNDPAFKPKIIQKIGSHKIDLPLNDIDSSLVLFDGQEIEAHCPTKFEYPESYNTKNKLYIMCENTYFQIKTNEESGYYGYSSNILLKCSSIKWNLYETNENFIWCPTNVTSYLLARPMESSSINYQYLAGICYDTHNLSIKSLYYTITPKLTQTLHPNVLSNSYKPTLKLEYVKETFATKSVTEREYVRQDIQDWIKFSQYRYNSIKQNSLVYNEFNHQFGSLLDVAWWPNLRIGNWKSFENALTKHVENQKQAYDILLGVSSVARAPIMKDCESNYTLTELRDNKNHIIPMYIWNYLRSTSNSSDEIVVIGFNSPFFEFYSVKDVIFCVDMCHEIPWLKNVSTTFRYSTLGVIFCCSVEDVKSSKRLDGFPEMNLDAKPETVSEEVTTENFFYIID